MSIEGAKNMDSKKIDSIGSLISDSARRIGDKHGIKDHQWIKKDTIRVLKNDILCPEEFSDNDLPTDSQIEVLKEHERQAIAYLDPLIESFYRDGPGEVEDYFPDIDYSRENLVWDLFPFYSVKEWNREIGEAIAFLEQQSTRYAKSGRPGIFLFRGRHLNLRLLTFECIPLPQRYPPFLNPDQFSDEDFLFKITKLKVEFLQSLLGMSKNASFDEIIGKAVGGAGLTNEDLSIVFELESIHRLNSGALNSKEGLLWSMYEVFVLVNLEIMTELCERLSEILDDLDRLGDPTDWRSVFRNTSQKNIEKAISIYEESKRTIPKLTREKFIESINSRFKIGMPAFLREQKNFIVKDGQTWVLRFDGLDEFRMKDKKALSRLCYLLENPYEQIRPHLLEGKKETDVPDAAYSGFKEIDEESLIKYKTRHQQITNELSNPDLSPEMKKKLSEEKKFYEKDLGKGACFGRAKVTMPRETRNIATRVRNSISRLVGEINDHCPVLADHLFKSISVSTHATYKPPVPTRWFVRR